MPASPRSTHRTSRRIAHGPRDGIPAAEFAANAVRSALFDGELKPGDQVNQYVWADRLGISRSALREGLKVLTSSKVLDHDPNRGYRVAEMGLAEMAELYWLRIAVDRENALSCRAPTEEEIEDLDEALAAIATAFEIRDPLLAMAAERDFMFKIYDLSERKLLAREAKRLWDMAAMFRSAGLELAVTERPADLERLLRRRTEQLDAVKKADGYALAEILVNDRRDMVKRFEALRFFPRS